MLEIRRAERKDKECWFALDKHISEEEFYCKADNGMAYVIWEGDNLAGVFRWNLFWEKEMKEKGYKVVMTSTQVDEAAQHFYRKIGYKDCGCLVLDIPEFEQPMEMFLIKQV